MAFFLPTYREVSRVAGRRINRNGYSRGFKRCSRALAAQNFTMPAMSPTMTEGNIACWKVKEGDTFSTGDVLLEIETDKAQMDVEAQDDGIMAKITQGDGTKGVKVGSRIAVLAEPDDDINSLSIPEEEPAAASSPQEDTKSGIGTKKSSESQAEAPPSSKGEDTPPSTHSEPPSPKRSSGKSTKQTYPLTPSVGQMLHEHGISSSEADKIPATGPKGRLLKGDVLAYLGTIKSSYSADQSKRIVSLSHLDLSNVKIAPPKQLSPPPTAQDISQPVEQESDTEIAVSISLKAVLEVQQRIQGTLGITLPLSTFIARATELANDDLPRLKTQQTTSDELFNQVLGLDRINPQTSRGSFTPQITALPPTSFKTRGGHPKKPDILDMLTSKPSMGSAKGLRVSPTGVMAGSGAGAATNVFSVSVGKGDEKRARIFLERVKTILQVEPGRLVL